MSADERCVGLSLFSLSTAKSDMNPEKFLINHNFIHILSPILHKLVLVVPFPTTVYFDGPDSVLSYVVILFQSASSRYS
jgi:hypothetical protein